MVALPRMRRSTERAPQNTELLSALMRRLQLTIRVGEDLADAVSHLPDVADSELADLSRRHDDGKLWARTWLGAEAEAVVIAAELERYHAPPSGIARLRACSRCIKQALDLPDQLPLPPGVIGPVDTGLTAQVRELFGSYDFDADIAAIAREERP